jgi:hypothetical protein
MASLDESWERAWESPRDYSEVLSSSGATVISCKTVADQTLIPILASFDADNRAVAIHIDCGLSGMGKSGSTAKALVSRLLPRRR